MQHSSNMHLRSVSLLMAVSVSWRPREGSYTHLHKAICCTAHLEHGPLAGQQRGVGVGLCAGRQAPAVRPAGSIARQSGEVCEQTTRVGEKGGGGAYVQHGWVRLHEGMQKQAAATATSRHMPAC